MGVSLPLLAIVLFVYLFAFVLAIGAERRRSTAKVVPDQYDDISYCSYASDASTIYGLAAFGLLAIAQTLINAVTRCYCCGRGMMSAGSNKLRLTFFIFSWASFAAAEICLLAGSARNAYHTKYRVTFHVGHLSCATLRKGVFAASAALILVTMVTNIVYYWLHCRADTGGWVKHQNEGLDLTDAKNRNPRDLM